MHMSGGNLETSMMAAFLVGAVAAVLLTILVYQFHLERLHVRHEREIKEAARRSVEQSRSTLKGQMAEQMAPFLSGFAYSPADSRFLGDPIDYIVFEGRTRLGESAAEDDDIEIVLVEVKHGQSKLTRIQRAIARAVDAGRVRFEINRVADDGSISRMEWRKKETDS